MEIFLGTIDPVISSVTEVGKENIFLNQLKFEMEEKVFFWSENVCCIYVIRAREVRITGYWSKSLWTRSRGLPKRKNRDEANSQHH